VILRLFETCSASTSRKSAVLSPLGVRAPVQVYPAPLDEPLLRGPDEPSRPPGEGCPGGGPFPPTEGTLL
jgi:hypothetical protein